VTTIKAKVTSVDQVSLGRCQVHRKVELICHRQLHIAMTQQALMLKLALMDFVPMVHSQVCEARVT
jgi:hypothetical protein